MELLRRGSPGRNLVEGAVNRIASGAEAEAATATTRPLVSGGGRTACDAAILANSSGRLGSGDDRPGGGDDRLGVVVGRLGSVSSRPRAVGGPIGGDG